MFDFDSNDNSNNFSHFKNYTNLSSIYEQEIVILWLWNKKKVSSTCVLGWCFYVFTSISSPLT
jgi:hypothetical protein